MQWILLAVIVAALLYLSRYFPKIAFSVLGVLAAGAIVIVLTTTDIAVLSQSKISSADIQVENPVMSPAYGGSYRFSARLLNNNKSNALRELAVSITMLDCENDGDDSCSVIGQQDERINIKIPPGQARDVSRTISFDGAVSSGIQKWEFKITHTRT